VAAKTAPRGSRAITAQALEAVAIVGVDKTIGVERVAIEECGAMAVCACASPLPGEQLGEKHTQCLAQEVAVSGEQKPHSTRQ